MDCRDVDEKIEARVVFQISQDIPEGSAIDGHDRLADHGDRRSDGPGELLAKRSNDLEVRDVLGLDASFRLLGRGNAPGPGWRGRSVARALRRRRLLIREL